MLARSSSYSSHVMFILLSAKISIFFILNFQELATPTPCTLKVDEKAFYLYWVSNLSNTGVSYSVLLCAAPCQSLVDIKADSRGGQETYCSSIWSFAVETVKLSFIAKHGQTLMTIVCASVNNLPHKAQCENRLVN